MEHIFPGIFKSAELASYRTRSWIYHLYIQEFLKQAEEYRKSFLFRLKLKLGLLPQVAFNYHVDKLLKYKKTFSNIKSSITATIDVNGFGDGYLYVYAEDNIKDIIKHNKGFSGLFSGAWHEDAKNKYIGNIYINLTIKKDIEAMISSLDSVDFLFLMEAKLHYLNRTMRHEFIHAIQSVIGTRINDGGIGGLLYNSPKDLGNFLNPKIANSKEVDKYLTLKEAEKPYEIYPYIYSAVDSFIYWRPVFSNVSDVDFINVWTNHLCELGFLNKLNEIERSRYNHLRPLIVMFWVFVKNMPDKWKNKAYKKFYTAVDA